MSSITIYIRLFLLCTVCILVVCYFLAYASFFSNPVSYFNSIRIRLNGLQISSVKHIEQRCRNISIILFQPNRTNLAKNLYVTAWPNHGAGIGHQFGEWVQGLWAAYRYNITYVFTPFLMNSAHWNSFLGFGNNEIMEDDLRIHYDQLNVSEFRSDMKYSISTENWILKHRRQYADQYPNNNALLLRLHRINSLVSYRNARCFLPIVTKLRMKYCVARVAQVLRINLYEDDFSNNRFIVAVHLRCGDSCYNSYRVTSLVSIENTILMLHETISQYYQNRQVVFHIFSQSPKNTTAEKHFHLLLHSDRFLRAKPLPVKIIPHFSINAPITLHHFITADLLLTAQSGFSEVAVIFRLGITFGAVQSCDPKLSILSYNKNTGNISISELKSALDYAQSVRSREIERIKYQPRTIEDCYQYGSNELFF